MMRSVFTFAIASAVVCVTSLAQAYCRSTTCPKEQCDPNARMCWEVGAPLYWPVREVPVATASGSALRGISAQTASEVFAAALAAWTGAGCSDARTPSISVSPMRIDESLASLSSAGEDEGLDGVNALYFVDAGWPHGPRELALTTTSFRVNSGRIIESDVEVNSQDNAFTVGGLAPALDLLSVLTHEAGHFFGLNHVFEAGPIMFVEYSGATTLDADDVAGMCAIYPTNRVIAEAEDGGGCGCRFPGSAQRPLGWLALVALGAALVARRRRSSA